MALINYKQFHRLFTIEDKHYFHLHKIFGLICLINFFWKLYDNYVNKNTDISLSYLPVIVFFHGILHITSFQFHIPTKRNKKYNIIWPEMRWHTMIFAYRSLIAMLVQGYLSQYYSDLSRGLIVLLTIVSADLTTYYYKYVSKNVEEKDSTMRGNPYPDWVSPKFIKYHNLFYSLSQVLGTLNILSHRDQIKLYMVLLPIQTAPFCMTLVKKGIMSQGGWHVYYTIALLMNYILYSRSESCIFPGNLLYYVAFSFAILRFGFNVNKYILWIMIILLQLYFVVNI